MRRRVRQLLLLAALPLLALVGGCDYPEAGFYELAAVGKQGRAAYRVPFMIEELVDDTDLTYGFNVLLPRDGTLVIAPLENSQDFSARGWHLRLADSDSQAGDFDLTLTHIEERMRFAGLLRSRGASQSALFTGQGSEPVEGFALAGEGEKPGAVEFGALPADIAEQLDGARWELRRLSQAQFEKELGAKVADAPRRDAKSIAAFAESSASEPASSETAAAEETRPRLKRDKPGFGGKRGGDHAPGP